MFELGNSLSSKRKFILQLLALFTAFFTPFAYLIGLTYYQGYMTAFGVSADTFPKSTADIYVDAYFAIGLMMLDLADLLAMPFKSSKSCGLLLLIGAVIFTYFKVKPFVNNIQSSESFKRFILKVFAYLNYKNNDLTKTVAYVFIPTYLITLMIYLLIFVLIFWLGLPHWANNKGKQSANEQIKKYIAAGCMVDKKTHWSNCVCVQNINNKCIQEGLLIAQNGNNLAIFKRDGSLLFSLNDSDIIRRKRN